jgi:hypothetical protein
MVDELYRYNEPVEKDTLPQLLENPDYVAKTALGLKADLKKLKRRITQEITKNPTNRAQLDVALVEDVHQTFKHLPAQVC